MRGRVGLVSFVEFRQPVVPDFCSRAVFVGNFADVCAFGVVWVRWMRVVFGGQEGACAGWCREGWSCSWLVSLRLTVKKVMLCYGAIVFSIFIHS